MLFVIFALVIYGEYGWSTCLQPPRVEAGFGPSDALWVVGIFFCMAKKILQFISVFCLFGLLFVVCVHLCQLLVTDWCPSAGKAICSKFYYLLSICCVQLLYLFLYASWWHDSVVRTLVFGRRTFPDFCQIHGWRVTTLWVNYGSGNSVRTQPSIPLGLANE